jgi:hypothetical protein
MPYRVPIMASVRVGAFMGYRIIAYITQTPVTITNGRAVIADSRWGGYLANLTPGVCTIVCRYPASTIVGR